MGSEMIQFGVMIGIFALAAIAWLFVIYLPGRSMEGQWEGDRAERAAQENRSSSTRQTEKETISV